MSLIGSPDWRDSRLQPDHPPYRWWQIRDMFCGLNGSNRRDMAQAVREAGLLDNAEAIWLHETFKDRIGDLMTGPQGEVPLAMAKAILMTTRETAYKYFYLSSVTQNEDYAFKAAEMGHQHSIGWFIIHRQQKRDHYFRLVTAPTYTITDPFLHYAVWYWANGGAVQIQDTELQLVERGHLFAAATMGYSSAMVPALLFCVKVRWWEKFVEICTVGMAVIHDDFFKFWGELLNITVKRGVTSSIKYAVGRVSFAASHRIGEAPILADYAEIANELQTLFTSTNAATRAAMDAWYIVAQRRALCSKDIRMMISRMIWETRKCAPYVFSKIE